MGTPAFAVPVLVAVLDAGHDVVAVYAQPDRPSGRGKRSVPSPVKRFAEEAGLRVLPAAVAQATRSTRGVGVAGARCRRGRRLRTVSAFGGTRLTPDGLP